MGAIFHVGVRRVRSVAELPAPRVALVAREGRDVAEGGAATWIVGAEREGVPADVLEACDAVAHIPIAGESLNAAMAATVALYETDRIARRA
jgi:TrmH family RNA methyltransferase